MKITIDLKEVQQIVAADLLSRGYPVDPASAGVITITQGQYEDAITSVTGLSFELRPEVKQNTEVERA